MVEIVDSVKQVATVMSEIATASKEQSEGIGQVNIAVTQMDGMTQQNSNLVREEAAASGAMGKSTQRLNTLVGFFTIGKDAVSGTGSVEQRVKGAAVG